jgi:hypothetical protein
VPPMPLLMVLGYRIVAHGLSWTFTPTVFIILWASGISSEASSVNSLAPTLVTSVSNGAYGATVNSEALRILRVLPALIFDLLA